MTDVLSVNKKITWACWMQASVRQEENREADKLRRFRICGDVSKQAGMSSGALIKKKKLCVYQCWNEEHSRFSISENIL